MQRRAATRGGSEHGGGQDEAGGHCRQRAQYWRAATEQAPQVTGHAALTCSLTAANADGQYGSSSEQRLSVSK